jgi:hypothetical protein
VLRAFWCAATMRSRMHRVRSWDPRGGPAARPLGPGGAVGASGVSRGDRRRVGGRARRLRNPAADGVIRPAATRGCCAGMAQPRFADHGGRSAAERVEVVDHRVTGPAGRARYGEQAVGCFGAPRRAGGRDGSRGYRRGAGGRGAGRVTLAMEDQPALGSVGISSVLSFVSRLRRRGCQRPSNSISSSVL